MYRWIVFGVFIFLKNFFLRKNGYLWCGLSNIVIYKDLDVDLGSIVINISIWLYFSYWGKFCEELMFCYEILLLIWLMMLRLFGKGGFFV